MSLSQITRWVQRHDERHDRLGQIHVGREVYDRDQAELRKDIEQLQATLTRAVWAIVSLVVAVLANLIAIWGGRI